MHEECIFLVFMTSILWSQYVASVRSFVLILFPRHNDKTPIIIPLGSGSSEPSVTYGVNFSFEPLGSLLSCAQMLPPYPKDIVATENK